MTHEMAGQSGAGRKKSYAPRVPPEVRRQQLLDATLRLASRDGYTAVTMEAVAREAGVAKPVLYAVFPNRDDLLHALLDREEQRAWAQIARVMPQAMSDDPPTLFAETVTAFLTAVRGEPDIWRVLLTPPEGSPPEIRTRFESARALIVEQAADFAAWATENLEREVDAELLGEFMVSTAETLGRLTVTDPERWTTDRLTRFTAEVARSFWNDRDD